MESFEENVAALTTSTIEPDLQSSVMTGSAADSDETSVSGGNCNNNGSGWLSDFRAIALSLQQTAGGVANFVHRSAVAIADEIAQLEQEEMEKHHHHHHHHSDSTFDDDQACGEGATTKVLPLPWELPAVQDNDDEEGDEEEFEASFVEDSQLKDKILQLGNDDAVFLGPFTNTQREEDADFLDEARIALIRRLLQIDHALARTHARLSGRSDVRETLFWKNYFYHVEQTQASHTALTSSLDSLVPAEEEEEQECNEHDNNGDDWEKEADAAFVQIPTPPASTNSLGVHSVDSMVVIDGPTVAAATTTTAAP